MIQIDIIIVSTYIIEKSLKIIQKREMDNSKTKKRDFVIVSL